ncbi:MAG: serine/threonine-protein kinase [bacterium]
MTSYSVGMILRSRYKIARIIYQSQMFNVYYVEDLHLKGKVWAIKEMKMVAVDPQEKNRIMSQFHAEALNLTALSHPNIAKVVDFFIDSNSLYIVREYAPAVDLGNVIKKDPIEEKEVLSWGIQMADALNYLFSRKMPAVFFRELNLGNILVSGQGNITLIDLGLARLFQTRQDLEAIKRTGSMDYAAPEQFSEEGIFDMRTLVYNLGAILFHCLTKVNPASTPFNLPAPQSLRPEVSDKFNQIILKATRYDPRERYPNLQEMVKDLKGAMEQYQSPDSVQSWVQRKKNPAAANFFLWLLVLATGTAAVWLFYYFILRP